MSSITCETCNTEWAATVRPCCPNCLLQSWLASPDLVTRKHHPDNASQIHDDYRSTVSDEILSNLRAVLEDAIAHGTWYYNSEYEKYNHVTHLPLRLKAGMGQSAGNARPDRHLEDLVIADADQDPHLFADDRNMTRRKITSGIYQPLPACGRAKCDNLSPPRAQHCALHLDPPLATRTRDAGRRPARIANPPANRRNG